MGDTEAGRRKRKKALVGDRRLADLTTPVRPLIETEQGRIDFSELVVEHCGQAAAKLPLERFGTSVGAQLVDLTVLQRRLRVRFVAQPLDVGTLRFQKPPGTFRKHCSPFPQSTRPVSDIILTSA
jgi:hypothetical protein